MLRALVRTTGRHAGVCALNLSAASAATVRGIHMTRCGLQQAATGTASVPSTPVPPASPLPTTSAEVGRQPYTRTGAIAGASQPSATATPSPSYSSTPLSPTAAAWYASHQSHYTPLNPLQRSLLFAGSSVLALLNPHRGDLVAAVSELTGPLTERPLQALRQKMLSTEEGRWIMEHKPRLDSTSMPLQLMRDTYPRGSLGEQYARFMLDRRYSPDSRSHVRFLADPELSYVLQRYREIHDLLHVLTGMPTSVLGELGQKAFESAHFQLTMPRLSATVAPAVTLSQADRAHYYSTLVPWSEELQRSIKVTHLLAIRYELYLKRDLNELRREWGIIPAPRMPDEHA